MQQDQVLFTYASLFVAYNTKVYAAVQTLQNTRSDVEISVSKDKNSEKGYLYHH